MIGGRYLNKWFGISAALVASMFIVLWGVPWNPIKALTSPGFYIALTTSFLIALLLIFIIHRTTLYLDKVFDWQKRTAGRIVLQLSLCIILPLYLDLELMHVYISRAGDRADWDKFLLVDFLIVVAFITLLNTYYVIHYLVHMLRAAKLKKMEMGLIDNDQQFSMLTINYNGAYAKLNVATDVLYCYRSGKTVKVFTVIGHEYQTKDTISNLHERFKNDMLLQVNPSVLINLNTVKGYKAGSKRDTLQVLFKPQYHHAVKDQESELFRITKEHIANFKATIQDSEMVHS